MLMVLRRGARNNPTTNVMYGKCLIGYRKQENKEERKKEKGKEGHNIKWRRGRS